MERSEPERQGLVLEEVGLEKRRTSWTSTRSKRAEEELLKEKKRSLGLVKSTQEQVVRNERVERRLLGSNFLLV